MYLRQEIKLEQRLRLTPEIQQAIRLLQLSRLELQETVQQEVLENPVLDQEYDESATESIHRDASSQHDSKESGAVTGETPDASMRSEVTGEPERQSTEELKAARKEQEEQAVPSEEDDQQLRNLVEQYQTFSTAVSGAARPSDEELPPIDNRFSGSPTLYEHLEWQLNLSPLEGIEKKVALAIIEAVGDTGYVTLESLTEIAVTSRVSQEAVAEVLYHVQQFDPPGIASVTLRDCFLIQARAFYPDREKLHELIDQHLPDLEIQRYKPILKKLKIKEEELRELFKLLASLDPRPGLRFSEEDTQYITPDVYIRKDGDDYIVDVNDDGMPRLKISPLYERLLDGRATGDEAEYLKKKLRQARWLIQSIGQRQRTIRRVAEKIVEFQREFLDHGVERLRPMVLRDIANAINVHESTVSRVTSNKYVHTPRGIFELKFFFGHRIQGVDGADHSQLTIKKTLKEIIEGEPREKPLSDQKLKELLLEQHRIDLARRTITKYREEMGIPSSSVRRRRL
jgi:RNA polymerase sigma-54 factor